MIDEATLERLLAAEADTYVPPADGPDRIRAAATEVAERRPRRAPWLAAAAAVVGVAAALSFTDSGLRPGPARTSVGVTTTSQSALDGPRAPASPDPQFAYDKEGDGGWSGSGSTGGNAAPAPADPKVVRTGEVSLEVPKARVEDVLSEAVRIAGTHGGFVAESSTEAAKDSPTGTVTVRVPVARFDRAVADLSALGEVRSATTKGEDVSDQVTDTAARLKTLTATRSQYQTLLARARNVGEVLAVQSKITDVQMQIEQLQARQASLADRTTYGTVRVSVSPPRPDSADDEDETGFAKAWDDAVDSFVGGFEWLVAASGPIAFATILVLALFVLGRFGYRTWGRRVV